MNPIWKDYYLTIAPDASGVPFTVTDRNTSVDVYEGRAFQKPSGGSIRLRINDIAADCFHRHFFPADNEVDDPRARIGIEYGSGTVVTAEFSQDWSYDENFVDTDWLNRPIGNFIAEGQLLPITTLGTSKSGTLYYGGGSTTFSAGGYATTYVDLSNYASVKGVRLGAGSDYLKAVCARWVVYYINQYGGWDWCVLRGGVTEGDNVTRYTTDKVYDNSVPGVQERGVDNYASDVVHTYVMRTGALDEQASGRIKHLATTSNAFLHDLENDTIVPIVITTNSMQYTRNGRMTQYEITAQLAQQRRR